MKILYVEDELSKNIPYIISLFSKYLGRERIEKLEDIETDEYDRIKKILEDTDLVEVADTFPDALDKLINNYDIYALFIVDRNLSESEYYPDQVRLIDPDYGQTQYDEYFRREGDYLLYKMSRIRRADVMRKFYYLTEHSDEKDKIIRRDAIKSLVDINKFRADNFIRKGDKKGIRRLRLLIDNIEVLDLRNENRHYLMILRNRLDEKASRRLLHILHNKDSDDKDMIAENLESLRDILIRILTDAATHLKAPDSCRDIKNRLIIKNFLRFLTRDQTGQRTHYKFDTNSLLKSFLYAIYGISIDFRPRDEPGQRPPGYQPTANTVNALVYALKDVILWFDNICKKH